MSLLYGNWYFIFNGMGSPLASQLWSICVEEQFYAVWPSVFKMLPARGFLGVTMVIAAGSLASVFLLASTGSSTLGIWLNTLPQAVFFATGAALALKMDFNQRSNTGVATVTLVGGCCCWVLADVLGVTKIATHNFPWRMTGGYALVALGCGLLLAGSLKFPAARVPKWSIYLGKISYGLYVFHALVLNLIPEAFGRYLVKLHGISIVVIFGVTVLMAAASYRWIESPFLRLKNRFETVKKTRSV